ncbi:hypothetical protein [Streptomyces sp. FZ201]|uniref:hypothetical protein n=1 Tax=Streptomyces sp. FZ201 TaxID=3057122 RepID=UPI0021C192E5|nr:hypothetical protein [Streptomyces sp. FZ201]
MSESTLLHRRPLSIKPRRVTGATIREALRVIERHFESEEREKLRTQFRVPRTSPDEDDGFILASADTLDALLQDPAILDALPMGAPVTLTNLTAVASNADRMLHLAVSADGVEITIASANEDWARARHAELRRIFTPSRRFWDLRSTAQLRDFFVLGMAVDALLAALLYVLGLPAHLDGTFLSRAAFAAALAVPPLVSWGIGRLCLRRCAVRISSAEQRSLWRSLDTMERLTFCMLLIAVITLIAGLLDGN